MRFSLIICCLLFFNTLSGQAWEAVEWVTKDSQRDTGWVKKPFDFWRDPLLIKLKKEQNRFANVEGKNLLLLKGLSGDTLLFSTLYNGQSILLQQIVKGNIALCREVKKNTDNYYLYANGEVTLWDRYDIKEDIYDLLSADDIDFYDRVLLRNKDEIWTVTRKMSHEKSSKKRDRKIRRKGWGELPLKKWRYDAGALLLSQNRSGLTYSEIEQTKNYFYIGLNRQLVKTAPHLSFSAHLAYFTKKEEIDSWRINSIVYEGQTNTNGFKASVGFQLELLPRKNFSPYFGIGYVYALAPKFTQIAKVKLGTWNFNSQGKPSTESIKARFSSELGDWAKLGLRYNITEKTRIDLRLQIEQFEKIVDFRDLGIESELIGGNHTLKILEDEEMLILSINRAF